MESTHLEVCVDEVVAAGAGHDHGAAVAEIGEVLGEGDTGSTVQLILTIASDPNPVGVIAVCGRVRHGVLLQGGSTHRHD